MQLTITHNLIFKSEDEAKAFKQVAYDHWEHLKDSPMMKLTQHGSVLVCNEKTYTKLDAGGMLDDAVR